MNPNGDTRFSESLGRGHETRDARIRPLVISLIALILIVLLGMLSMKWLRTGLEQAVSRPADDRHPLADSRPLFPEPRLQTAPRRDLEELRAWEENLAQSYGWVDRSNGTVRIPVESALEIVLEEGLPAREPPAGGGSP